VILLSTGTESGQKVARERVAEATATFYFPLDLPFVVQGVIRKIRPDLFLVAETELWPNFLHIAKRKRGPHPDGQRPDFRPILSPL